MIRFFQEDSFLYYSLNLVRVQFKVISINICFSFNLIQRYSISRDGCVILCRTWTFSIYVSQRRLHNVVKYLSFKSLCISEKCSILDVWPGFEYVFMPSSPPCLTFQLTFRLPTVVIPCSLCYRILQFLLNCWKRVRMITV